MANPNEPVVKSARKARGAEPGPSMLVVLMSSVALALVFLGIVYFVFFMT